MAKRKPNRCECMDPGSRLRIRWQQDFSMFAAHVQDEKRKQADKCCAAMMRELKAADAVQVDVADDGTETWEIPPPKPVKCRRVESVVSRGLRTGTWPKWPGSERRGLALHRNYR